MKIGGYFMNEFFLNEAFKEAKKAFDLDEIPVGCVIVYKNHIISRAHNCKELKNNAIMHAEILAVDRACKKLKSWRLDDCILYTTLEPCLMCTGAILECRIKNVYYGTSSKSKQMFDIKDLDNINFYDMENIDCSNILSDFFQIKRLK